MSWLAKRLPASEALSATNLPAATEKRLAGLNKRVLVDMLAALACDSTRRYIECPKSALISAAEGLSGGRSPVDSVHPIQVQFPTEGLVSVPTIHVGDSWKVRMQYGPRATVQDAMVLVVGFTGDKVLVSYYWEKSDMLADEKTRGRMEALGKMKEDTRGMDLVQFESGTTMQLEALFKPPDLLRQVARSKVAVLVLGISTLCPSMFVNKVEVVHLETLECEPRGILAASVHPVVWVSSVFFVST